MRASLKVPLSSVVAKSVAADLLPIGASRGRRAGAARLPSRPAGSAGGAGCAGSGRRAVNVCEAPRRRAGWGWIASTSLLAFLWLSFLETNVRASLRVARPVGLGAMLLEFVVVSAYLLRRQPLRVSRSPLAWLAAIVGAFGMLFGRPAYAPVGGLEPLYVVLQLAGALGASLSLLALGRSFGLVAANRGIASRGPYRIVRHPAYACELIALAGYLLENPSPHNVLLMVLVAGCQLIRIHYEEAVLNTDPAYSDYARRVRYRLLPYLY
jgi:protein-S-isoprenylcysteine O-methyltransferase Ste14